MAKAPLKVADLEKEYVIKSLKEGYSSDFWEIMQKVIIENIEIIDDEIRADCYDVEKYSHEEFKMRIVKLEARKETWSLIINTPIDIYNSFESGDGEAIERVDVYDTKEDFLSKNENME